MKISSFKVGNIFQLVMGSVLAQLIFVIVTPLLTRIYSPEQLGVFGAFFAIVLILSRIAGLRFDLAIPLPRSDVAAFHLIVAVLFTSVIMVSIGVSINRYLLAAQLFEGNAHLIQQYDLILALGIVGFVVFESFSYWFTRKKQFNVVANGKIIVSFVLAGLQLLGYFYGQKILVLLAAYPVSMGVGIVYMLSKFENGPYLLSRLRMSIHRKVIYRYREFPLVSVWSTTLMELSQSLPLLMITITFGNAEAGFFFLARRIGLVPTSVVGRAITLVNYTDMVEFKKDNVLKEKLLVQIRQLQMITFVPAVVLAILAPAAISIILGESWRSVGVFLQLITPFVYVKLIFSPMNAINYVQGWQKIALLFEIVSTGVSGAAMYWLATQGQIYHSVGAYFLFLALFNIVYRTYLMSRIGISIKELLMPTLQQLLVVTPLVVLWAVYS